MARGMDRLSALPDELLHHIISFLPSTKLRAITSVLSMRWRHLWSSTPALEFFYPSPDSASVIDRCLHLFPNSTLRRLRIHFSPGNPPPIGSLDLWIRFAASRSVNHLALRFVDNYHFPRLDKPQLPPSLLLCSSSISSLNLSFCAFPQITTADNFLGFPSLKILSLIHVAIGDEAVEFLIQMSPNLETLNLDSCSGITRIEISSVRNPCIEKLKLVIRGNNGEGCNVWVFVDAPRLRFFHYEGLIQKLELRNAPRLVGAEISTLHSLWGWWSMEDWMGIMSAISSAEVLRVGPWFFEPVLRAEEGEPFEIRGPMFKNLKELWWNGNAVRKNNRRAITFFLRECPSLESLYVTLNAFDGMMYEDELPVVSNEDEEFEQLIEDDGYLLSRLTMVSITDFFELDEEMKLVEFILRKATVLELLSIFIGDVNGEPPISGRMFQFPSASPNLEIDMWGMSTVKPRKVRTFRHLWDF